MAFDAWEDADLDDENPCLALVVHIIQVVLVPAVPETCSKPKSWRGTAMTPLLVRNPGKEPNGVGCPKRAFPQVRAAWY